MAKAIVWQGKRALITGASSGIGRAFAHELASKGMNLILVARSERKLADLAEQLKRRHGIDAAVLIADLSQAESPQAVYEACRERNLAVDMLINNAGFATHGSFEQIDAARQQEEVNLNVSAVMKLSHLFLPAMQSRRFGAVINVSSTAAFQPDPYMAVYGATKSFVLSFTEALHEENRSRGVRCLALCPGSTETAFFDVVAAEEASVGQRQTPEFVVAAALRALDRGRSYAVPGRRNYALAQLSRLLPRKQMASIVGGMLRPKKASPPAGAHA